MACRALRLSVAAATLSVWAFALGCGETNGGTAPGSPATGCPVTAPLEGSACDADGTCAYSGTLSSAPCSPPGFKATCADGQWQLAANQFIGCNTITSCPLSGPPPDGELCVVTGVVCTYNEEPCKEIVHQCVSDAWKTTEVYQTDCGAPVPQPPGGAACPVSVPSEGQACATVVGACEYRSVPPNCGFEVKATATCVGGSWQVETPDLACNAPETRNCPKTLPDPDSNCFGKGEGLVCGYPGRTCDRELARCNGAQWRVFACESPGGAGGEGGTGFGGEPNVGGVGGAG